MPHTILHEVSSAFALRESVLPLRRWAGLVAVAVAGSLLYGSSLSWVLHDWKSGGAALWIALGAGLAWGVFIPALRFGTRLSWVACLDSSLIVMAFGEVILVNGAVVNWLLQSLAVTSFAALINGLLVAISNLTMAVALTLLLRARGVPPGRTVALWMVVLNGSGAVFFLALYHALHGP
ncbi:MAG: thiamine transporter [Chthoniobacter sp.]|jgi:hypothetical protein|nr:thiamine transporter [Chthoniobacter sp.]